MGKKNTSSRRIQARHYPTYWLYRTFEFFLRLMPMELVCVIGGALGQAGWLLMHGRREMVIRNLRIALGEELDIQEIRNLCRQTFRNSGVNFLASVRATTMSADELRKRMKIDGIEHLESATAQGHGAILLLAHMGNWEMLTQMHLVAPCLVPLAGLYRPLDNPLLDRLIKRRRQSMGTTLFSRRDGFFKPISHLKSGGTLGAIADQHAGDHGMAVPFFGKLTSMTNLPALLHRRTGAPVIPVSMVTCSPGNWRIVVHPALDINEEQKKNASEITALCAKAYETVMLEHPTDVLWMHRYWRVGAKSPLKIDGTQKKKPTAAESAARKPFNVLVFTGRSTTADEDLQHHLHHLKHYRPDMRVTLVGQHSLSPEADHFIPFDPAEPPHLVANAIRDYDLAQTIPFDCALDLTPEAAGARILEMAELARIFTMRGKHQSISTKKLFADLGTSSTGAYLRSLGLQS